MLCPWRLDCKCCSYAADLKMKDFICMYIGDEAFKAGLLIYGQWAGCMAFGPVIYCIYKAVTDRRSMRDRRGYWCYSGAV